jgi:hypothetical protein
MGGRLAKTAVMLSPLVLVLTSNLAQGRPPGLITDSQGQAKALAAQIDRLIDADLAKAGLKPAPPAEDAEFFRRLVLDLNGRIPSLTEIDDFLSDDSPAEQRRDYWINRILENETADHKGLFTRHWAAVMRSWMLSGSGNNFQARIQEPQFEAWLEQKLRQDGGYARIVREILKSSPVGGFAGPGVPSPSAFYFDNENKAENLAGATARIFLGVKIECAQCHKHPFASWTKNQFWEYAAFFSTVNNGRPIIKMGRVVPVTFRPGEITIPGTDKVARARFLDGKEPDFKSGDPRSALADWMTANDNPYFAKAAVDHFWRYFFGVSLLEPITEPQEGGPPAHPELLDLLAREFRNHGYQVKFLVRALVSTRAYQRTSSAAKAVKDDVYYFARMPVRALSPEQLFDSVAEATEYKEPPGMAGQPFNPFNPPQTPRREFLAKFAGQGRHSEAETSILQALFMMNGRFLAERTRLENNVSLQALANERATPAKKLRSLYLMVLSRPPRPEEEAHLVPYLESGGPTHDQGRALADVYWALLNSGEFCLNH